MDPTAFASWRRRSVFLLLNAVLFSLCYTVANLVAQAGAEQRSLMFALDRQIPLVPWMIIPYLSSGLIFAASFFLVRSVDELRVLSARLLMATVVASLIFVLFPFQFSFVRPPIDAPLLQAMFDYLAWADRPFNQLPSLHVAYCVIFWCALRQLPARRVARAGLAIWLVLVAASTVFTWQHHVLDVAGGLLLGAACVALIRPGAREARVGFYYVVAAIQALFGAAVSRWLLPLTYVAASCLMVARAYRRGDDDFLHKRDRRFPPITWLMYAPYLLLYRLTWLCVRVRERAHAPVTQLTPQLWVGRRLSAREAALLPAACSVIDLANELSETARLRSGVYRHFALLDLRTPDCALIGAIGDAIAAEIARGRIVYLHCAMGYSRSIFVAKYYTNRAGNDVFDLPVKAAVPATVVPLA